MSTDPEEGMAGMRRILVGVDSSEASLKALAWATMVARALGAQVVAMNGLVFLYSEIKPEMMGARGLGGFTGLRAGGVALAVVHRAELPVIMVPPADDD
jgi:nucleotide-binding universal stress UspA family protein